MEDAKGVSADELRKRLYKRFEKHGVLEDLKAKLRNHLANELNRDDQIYQATSSSDSKIKELKNIPKLISTWLIVDHLRRQSYDLTISTLMAEMSARKRPETSRPEMAFNALNKRDIYQILHIDDKEMSFCEDSLSGLVELVMNSKLKAKQPSKQECLTELTKEFDHFNSHMIEKLSEVEQKYQVNNAERENATLKPNDNVFEYNFKSPQSSETLFKYFEAIYSKKVKLLSDREKQLHATFEQQKKRVEEEAFVQRQSIISEIKSIRQREQETKLRLQRKNEDLTAFENKLRQVSHDLNERKLQAEQLSNNLEDVISKRMEEYKRQVDESLKSKFSELSKKEVDVEEKLKKLTNGEQKLETKVEEIDDVKKENFELEIKLEYANKEINKLASEVAVQNERLKCTWDYDKLKLELMDQRQETNNLRIKICSVTGERDRQELLIKELTQKFSEPSNSMVNLQREFDALKRKKNDGENVLKDEIRKFDVKLTKSRDELKESEKNLDSEIIKNKNILVQLIETKKALGQSQIALRSYINANLHPTEERRVSFVQPINREAQFQQIVSHSLNSEKLVIDNNFVEKAKLRIQALAAEANSLTKSYHTNNKSDKHLIGSIVNEYGTVSFGESSVPGKPKSIEKILREESPAMNIASKADLPKRTAKRSLKFWDKNVKPMQEVDFSEILHTSTPLKNDVFSDNLDDFKPSSETNQPSSLSLRNTVAENPHPIASPSIQDETSFVQFKEPKVLVQQQRADDVVSSSNTETLSSIKISAGNITDELPSNNVDDFSW